MQRATLHKDALIIEIGNESNSDSSDQPQSFNFDEMKRLYHASICETLMDYIENGASAAEHSKHDVKQFRKTLKKFKEYINSKETLQPDIYRSKKVMGFFSQESESFRELN